MAYNRWLSSQYSYSPSTDLMHYGRKGMRWGKHIFGLPEITLNGGGGLLEEEPEEPSMDDVNKARENFNAGKIPLQELLSTISKYEKDYAAYRDAMKVYKKTPAYALRHPGEVASNVASEIQYKAEEVYDKMKSSGQKALKRASDTYENYKAGDSADKKPDRREYHPWDIVGVDKSKKYDATDDYDAKKRGDYWIRSYDGRKSTDWELDKEYEKNRKANQEEKRSAADRARVNSKIQDRKGQESRDRKENLERKRAERSAAPRTVSKSSNQNGSSKTTSKDNYSLEDIVKLAFGSASASGSTSTGSTRTPNQNKEPKKETYDVTAKQKKIYQTIGKFLNYALTVTNPYHSLRK